MSNRPVCAHEDASGRVRDEADQPETHLPASRPREHCDVDVVGGQLFQIEFELLRAVAAAAGLQLDRDYDLFAEPPRAGQLLDSIRPGDCLSSLLINAAITSGNCSSHGAMSITCSPATAPGPVRPPVYMATASTSRPSMLALKP